MKVTQIELRGFSRTIAELEWLLLILTLLYFVAPSAIVTDQWGIILAMVTFAAFILSFRYSRLFTEETRWKLAIETWAMIIFISWVAFNTGGIDSPLLSLFLIVIMVSALTLGKVITLLEFILVTVVYIYFAQSIYTEDSFSLINFSDVMILFTPIILVGYVTTLLAADIHLANEELALLSDTDELTGVKNRRAFNKEFSVEAKRAVRYERPFSIMMLDSDNLKKINDQYGHPVGDSLIISLSQVIKSSLRETDILARYGGDEFVVMLPETGHSKAIEIAERIRQSVENTSFSADGNRVSSTLSIGVACYPEDSNISEEIIIKADKALYQSKLKGKNCVS
ncbi:MAG: GGDEF domain-containing protein [Gammaproteobacteria bacterium]